MQIKFDMILYVDELDGTIEDLRKQIERTLFKNIDVIEDIDISCYDKGDDNVQRG